MLAASRIALKEWAVICREVGTGRQIVLLRKGGIREGRPGFAVDHSEFFLFPTYVHQNEEELSEPVRAGLPEVARAAPPGGTVRLELYVRVAGVTEVGSLEPLRRIADEQALAWPAVERRFHYRRPGLHVIALRAYRLPRPLETPSLARYDGCRSWVELESELPVTDAEPVLDDATFARRLGALAAVLAPGSATRAAAPESA